MQITIFTKCLIQKISNKSKSQAILSGFFFLSIYFINGLTEPESLSVCCLSSVWAYDALYRSEISGTLIKVFICMYTVVCIT